MLDRKTLWQALEAKQSQFTTFDEDTAEQHRLLSGALEKAAGYSKADIETSLAGVDWPGAMPTEEHGLLALSVSGRDGWTSYERAIGWAKEVLRGTTTFAVDGSQLWVERDVSLPVGVVQIGWFENPHVPGHPYRKQVAMEVIPPDEVEKYGRDMRGGTLTAAARQLIGDRRFQMEAECLTDYITSQPAGDRQTVCFLDNPLIASYADAARPTRQRVFTDAICRLLEASERFRVPVVGYVDNSYALDLVTMVAHLNNLPAPDGVRDAGLLWPYLSWTDRTPAYVSARAGILERYHHPDNGKWYGDQVCFVYLQPSRSRREGSPPARVEFPRWLLEDGQLERVIDVVRAETIVGRGFPYGVEVADEAAVLTANDWEHFYTVLQQFLQRTGMPLRLSRKRRSKRGRR